MAPLNAKSMAPTTIANINDATNTRIELFCNSAYFGQETFVVISTYESLINAINVDIGLIRFIFCTGGRNRTHNQRFWRPLLYQLSYTRKYLCSNWSAKVLFFCYNTNAFRIFFLKRILCYFLL